MPRNLTLPLIGWLAVVWLSQSVEAVQQTEHEYAQKAIEELAKATLDAGPFPAIFVCVDRGDGQVVTAAAGIRKFGDETLVSVNDLVHIGSCTKAFTAVLIARLVEQGKLKWDQTILETFPDLKNHIHSDYHGKTLLELLRHQANLPSDAKDWWLKTRGSIHAQRMAIIRDSLAAEPPKATKNQFRYSNLSYMVAGAMAEKATGMDWESLLLKEVCEPLGIESAGFGPPGPEGKVAQPWGHVIKEDSVVPFQHDNAPALGPAGRLHLQLTDWAKFAAIFHENSQQKILSADSLSKIKTVGPNSEYGLGWILVDRQWGQGKVMHHTGSNTMWFANIWIAPKTNRTVIVVTNSAGSTAFSVLDKTVSQVLKIDSDASHR